MNVPSNLSTGLLRVKNGKSRRALFRPELVACIKVDSDSERFDETCKERKTIKIHRLCSNSLTIVAAVATGFGKLVHPRPQIRSPTIVAYAVALEKVVGEARIKVKVKVKVTSPGEGSWRG